MGDQSQSNGLSGAQHDHSSSSGSILLFGSLALSFDASTLRETRKNVVENDDNVWLLEVIHSLPGDCETVFSEITELQSTGRLSQKQLRDLSNAVNTGSCLDTEFPLPNTLLIPLVIIAQLTDYTCFLRKEAKVEDGSQNESWTGFAPNRETLGLCTGLLSAFAVASSHNVQELRRCGAAAVRLGMLVGMAIDSQEKLSGRRSKSLTAVWGNAKSYEDMMGILREFDHTYVSVHYDCNRATITTSAAQVSDLTRRLQNAGLGASEIDLYGAFHIAGGDRILSRILSFCDSHKAFQLPNASALAMPTRASDGSGLVPANHSLHSHALRSILVEPPRWIDTFTSAIQEANGENAHVISFGHESSVPQSLASRTTVVYAVDRGHERAAKVDVRRRGRHWMDSDIAVVGMSCKVAGADDVNKFWDLLVAGESQHGDIGSSSRICFQDGQFRSADDPNMRRKWFANLLRDPDQFDHRFFKKTARESASMDPQQRQLLQVAYQAIEQSGYFQNDEARRGPLIGCFVGLCLSDYENNVACHAANAFTATGNLQGFVAGKVSHFFGWTGPALTLDTACSSSLVAVHQACRSILSGECSAALAAGTHIMTSASWFQNLAAGSFLSPTGQCKPFDANADGYCRGEGVGAVFLKRLSDAVQDGDAILGVIAATAVQQNENCTPIFVPNVPSLGDLFTTVTAKARVRPSQISVVEAHGTGTAVGDPAEYGSIRSVLGGDNRTSGQPLMVSSVKGLVGHLECTSGIISLIKVLLMLNRRTLPPQASFRQLNPALKASDSDNMYIPTKAQAWDNDFRVSLINNYGASGSNASLVVIQPPSRADDQEHELTRIRDGVKHPFWLCGNDKSSLRRYASAFRKFIAKLEKGRCIASISFNSAHQSNRSLSQGLVFTANSVQELDQRLAVVENGDVSESLTPVSVESSGSKPVVILCFGGQISKFVGLDPQVYASLAVLRKHLDQVDAVIKSFGNESIFPSIFQRTAITDTVLLQTVLFATQYACAKCWMDCGVQPVALVGHSFGELTALCISQALTLEDAVAMIIFRAKIVRDEWGADQGSMMAIEGNLGEIKELLSECNRHHAGKPASVACYNGPRSFTLAGSTKAIDAVASKLQTLSKSRGFKSKRLDVTNAFHSALVDPLLDSLEHGARDLVFQKPLIHLERATEHASPAELAPRFVAEHLRNPVYFHHAVERLARKYASSPCIFLEAGTNSTITNMAERALRGSSVQASFSFQGLNISNCDDGWDRLVDRTVSLWREGLNVQHWAHHAMQRNNKGGPIQLMLPPYQFDPNARHWLDLRVPAKSVPTETAQEPEQNKEPEGLLSLFSQETKPVAKARFRVDTQNEMYLKLLSGHLTLETAPICPATVQIGFVIEALGTIRPQYRPETEPQIRDVDFVSPVCVSSTKQLWVEVENSAHGSASWQFEVFSTENGSDRRILHTTGRVSFSDANDAPLKQQLLLFERLFSHDRAARLLQSAEVDEVLGSRTIYRVFAEIVNYGDEFRGMQKLVHRGEESAGHIVRKRSDFAERFWFDAHLADTFCQFGGLWANCLTERSSDDVYLATRIDQWIRAPARNEQSEFHVFATHHRRSDRLSVSDVFVFDAASHDLLEVALGITYAKIPQKSMTSLLLRLTDPEWLARSSPKQAPNTATRTTVPTKQLEPGHSGSVTAAVASTRKQAPSHSAAPKGSERAGYIDLLLRVKAAVANLTGLEVPEIKDDSMLADLGIDSLTGMELINEIEKALKVKLPESEIYAVTDMSQLMGVVAGAMGLPTDSREIAASSFEETEEDSGSDTPSFTPFSDCATGVSTLTIPRSESSLDGRFATSKSHENSFTLATVTESFDVAKGLTDKMVDEHRQGHYVAKSFPLQNRLAVALTLEAFEELGANFGNSRPGERLSRIPHQKEHQKLVNHLYRMLEMETQIVTVNGDIITRTAVPVPKRQSQALYHEMLKEFPDQNIADQLIFYAGVNLKRVLSGETDGAKLIFGTSQGRSLVSAWYAEWPLNRVLIALMEEFLKQLTLRLQTRSSSFSDTEPLRIMEMGAGTGGTTRRLLPLLAQLKIPIEYTFSDLGPSFVAAARKTWGHQYPWMKFRLHNIEKTPEQDLLGTQHLVIASNAIHATRSLRESTENVRKALRPDGFLLMHEMTRSPFWVDLIFGLFEGWWLFDDGRKCALTHESRWETDLRAAGYGYVDWTGGERPEGDIEKLILAAASTASQNERGPETLRYPQCRLSEGASAHYLSREDVVSRYVDRLTNGFGDVPTLPSLLKTEARSRAKCIVITGATGNLGAHLVAEATARRDVGRVICLNRRGRGGLGPRERQKQALLKKGFELPREAMRKLDVYETDLSQSSNLGLPDDVYASLVQCVTHILHNAWLMHSKWPVDRFEPQLRIMGNMLRLARDISIQQPSDGRVVTFALVSSIATVGHHPIWTGSAVVPEERVGIESVLPTGYGDAKYICERMLDATLHRFPARFRATAVRLGQIAGGRADGHWNSTEHVPFLIKSSQTLGALPDLQGSMGWTPADDVAGSLIDIVTQPDDVTLQAIYHVENPIRQPWKEVISMLADALGIPQDAAGIIPFEEWLRRVRSWPQSADNRPEGGNPAYLLVDFLADNFIRMSCGGLLLGTARARKHSATMSRLGPVSHDLIARYVQSWRDTGFLA